MIAGVFHASRSGVAVYHAVAGRAKSSAAALRPRSGKVGNGTYTREVAVQYLLGRRRRRHEGIPLLEAKLRT